MRGSSGTRASAFEGVTLKRALSLVVVLKRSDLRTENQVRKAFSQHSRGFDAALSFLTRIGAIQEREGVLVIRDEPPGTDRPGQQEWLLSLLLRRRNRYRSEILKYLRKYQICAGELAYRVPVQHRSRESDVRNFLMELGIVNYDEKTDRCVLSREYVSLYASARELGHQVSPALLTKSLAARDRLALSAEMAAIEFEKKRLGPKLANEIVHVASRNVAAGYDIRSITVAEDSTLSPRYIEVKAVSPSSMRFHWTRNEISVARILQESYYLYLLPVDADGGFDFSGLMVLGNPCIEVLGVETEWIIEEDVIRCSLQSGSRAQRKHTGGTPHA